jgi:hypothetical protein
MDQADEKRNRAPAGVRFQQIGKMSLGPCALVLKN